MRTSKFLGAGIAFPFRINPNTGGVQTTVGIYDGTSVGLEFLDDRVTIREDINIEQNHIAESIANILLTRQGEDDTLPEFGSNLHYLIFEKHTQQFKLASQTWFSYATKRWENRISIDESNGVKWKDTWDDVLTNTLPLQLNLSFIVQQKKGNLVYPFVTPRQAVEQEYLPSGRDVAGYDSYSKYYPVNRKAVSTRGTFTWFRRSKLSKPNPDDIYYKVETLDTWRTISSRHFGDTRYSWVVARASIETALETGRGKDCINTLYSPNQGDLLRLPSRERIIMR
jgi:phage baseplate assembly protein W